MQKGKHKIYQAKSKYDRGKLYVQKGSQEILQEKSKHGTWLYKLIIIRKHLWQLDKRYWDM